MLAVFEVAMGIEVIAPLPGNRGDGIGRVLKDDVGNSEVSVHARLRTATRNEHEIVDRCVSRFDLGLLAGYVAFLRLNADALVLLKPSWRHSDEADFSALARALDGDLSALGCLHRDRAMPTQRPIHGLGLAYVVRGSRMGAKVLRRRVAPGLPTAYLDHEPAVKWRELLRDLETVAGGDREAEEAIIAGARATFAVYAELAQCAGRPT